MCTGKEKERESEKDKEKTKLEKNEVPPKKYKKGFLNSICSFEKSLGYRRDKFSIYRRDKFSRFFFRTQNLLNLYYDSVDDSKEQTG